MKWNLKETYTTWILPFDTVHDSTCHFDNICCPEYSTANTAALSIRTESNSTWYCMVHATTHLQLLFTKLLVDLWGHTHPRTPIFDRLKLSNTCSLILTTGSSLWVHPVKAMMTTWLSICRACTLLSTRAEVTPTILSVVIHRAAAILLSASILACCHGTYARWSSHIVAINAGMHVCSPSICIK